MQKQMCCDQKCEKRSSLFYPTKWYALAPVCVCVYVYVYVCALVCVWVCVSVCDDLLSH